MLQTKSLHTLAVLVVAASHAAGAQSLDGRHLIELRVGIWNQVTESRTEVTGPGASTTVGSSGVMGGLAYTHWLQEQLALEISAGGMAAGVDVEVGTSVSTETATVAMLLLGLKYYFPASTYGSSVRPFAGVALGPFIGDQLETEIGTTITAAARTEAAMGGEVSAGVDFVLGRHVLTSLALGYHLMSDFDKPIGGSSNYSGPQLTLGVGYLFGRGADRP